MQLWSRRDADPARDADHPVRVAVNRRHGTDQGAPVVDRVPVDAADVRIAAEIEPEIEGERLRSGVDPAVDDYEPRVGPAQVGHRIGTARIRLPGECRTPLEIELPVQQGEGAVAGAVVDDDDLMLRIVEPEQRTNDGDDHSLLVEDGHDHADGHRVLGPEDAVEALAPRS